MQYRKMPGNGDHLSALGFGCMRFPTLNDGSVDEKRAIQQIRYAIENGVNYFDTAWPYHGGLSEPLLGRALTDGYRERVKIATKLPTWLIEERSDMDTFLNQQLEKLQTNSIDYYLLHALNGRTWDHLEALGVLEFLDGALRDGRIVNAGFSFHGLLDDFKRIVDSYQWIFCQIQYNFLDEEYQAGTEGLHYAASKNLGVIVMEPLRGGNLGLPTPPPAVDDIWSAAITKRTPVEWALRWIWDHPQVTVVLSGMNDENHIEENLKIADKSAPESLTSDEHKIVRRAAAKYKELMKVNCTGCGYCMPCPEGVLIPWIFEVFNKMHLFGNREEAKFMYAVRMSGIITGEEPGFASQCIECGECLEKCPQNIDIPSEMTAISEEMEGADLEVKLDMVRKMMRAGAKEM